MEAILNFIGVYGVIGFLVIVIILIIQDPERAVKLQALFIKPFFNYFKWGAKQYIATEVGYTTTNYFRRHLSQYIPSLIEPRIRIKWVSSPEDPVFQSDGTLIIRLTETNDQARNILAATRVALPRVVYATLRPNLEQYLESAIDLTILKNLCDRLGKHAYPVFQNYFLTPEIEEDNRALDLFSKLIKIDESGIFVSILLEELTVYGDYMFSSGDTTDKTTDVIDLIEFLLGIATRQVGEEIKLEHISPLMRVGIVLLAKSWKAETAGLPPYLRRIDIDIKLGCDSIYIVTYPQARRFLNRLTGALDTDGRLTFIKRNSLQPRISTSFYQSGFSELVLYRRNKLYEDSNFSELVDSLCLVEGIIVEGTVVDVSQEAALTDLGGIYGVVSLEDCSWTYQVNCHDVLENDQNYLFLIKSINFNTDSIELSRKIDEDDPWQKIEVPETNTVVEATIRFYNDGTFICQTDEGLEILLHKEEFDWEITDEDREEKFIGTRQELLLIDINIDERKLRGSLRQIEEDPWIRIHEKLPKDKKIKGKILEVNNSFINIELPNGLVGYIPRQYIEEAGYEFKDFQEKDLLGKKIDVVVSKVFTTKRRIRLNLLKN